MKFIISAGYKYVDIDVLASSVALEELMLMQQADVSIHLTAPFNSTIPKTLTHWNIDTIKVTPPINNLECRFILVDISDPKHFESFVDINNVEAVFDHHYGYEEFWKSKLGKKAKIEPIGACATLIWEEFKNFNMWDKISPSAANLLYTAIISNTLTLKAQITSFRDKIAIEELSSFIKLPKNWARIYYNHAENALKRSFKEFIKKDTKEIEFANMSVFFAQVELWNANHLSHYDFFQRMSIIFPGQLWILNLISIEEGCSYIFSSSNEIFSLIKRNVACEHKERFLRTEVLWLRKEILKLLSDLPSNVSHE